MKDKRATLEVIAPTVEEAIAKGLADLGLPQEAVEVDVLDQGSRGLFGLGSRQARVRLAVKHALESGVGAVRMEGEEKEHARHVEARRAGMDSYEAEEDIRTPMDVAPARLEPAEAAEEEPEGEEAHELMVARETVIDLLDKMKVHARVSSHFGEVDEERTRVPILVDVHGDDLGILIGRRAEVLNALQYIAGLMVSKELGQSISLVVDVEGYRSRREGQLRQLARRMADQAIKTGRRQVLEPMPANERRIIHIELREHPSVRTESIGEDPRRKVTIVLKE